MKLALAALLLVLLGVAYAEEESSFVKKVRTKRKLAVPTKVTPVANEVQEPPLDAPSKDEPVFEDSLPNDPSEGTPEVKEPVLSEKKTKLSEDVKELQPPIAELNEAEAAERKKKEACIQMGDCAADCNPAVAAKQQMPMLIMKQAEPAPVMTYAKPQARTIDPIYSFGPVNVNGAQGAAGGGLGYHGASGYSGYSSGLYAAPEPLLAPASLQVHAVLPYAMTHHQRRPLVFNHNMPEVVYYGAAPESVYYSGNGGQSVHSSYESGYQSLQDEPVSLYCQPMRSSDLVKALGTDKVVHEDKDKVKKGEDADIAKHIKKVNQIGEELTNLNNAAQKLVQQQDQLAKMQSEHLMRSVPMVPSHGMDPLYRHFEEHMRTRPMHPYHYGMRPMFRESEQPAETQKTTASPNTATTSPPVNPQNQNPKTEKASQAAPENGAQRQDAPVPPQTDYQRQYNPILQPYQPLIVKSDEFQRQMPYFVPPYMYKNEDAQRQYPYYSETGFMPYSQMYKSENSNMASYPTTNEDVQFFKKLMDFGKRLGIDPNNPEQSQASEGKSKEKEHRSEDAISDLMYGNKQKNGGESQEAKSKSSDEAKPKTKRDHRELVMKKKE